MVPLSHGSSMRGKAGVAVVFAGGVTRAVAEVGQVVSLPVGTSEN